MIDLTRRRSAERSVRAAYRAILRREPSRAEVVRFGVRALSRGRFRARQFDLLRDMVDSEEFAAQILPSLVATRTAMSCREPIFFLHVPKTGGTSIRLAIGDAIGVPSFNVYNRWPTPDRTSHRFWPYWAGHAQADFFPEGHVGITMFREPRSRLLSLYRQQEALRSQEVRHGWEFRGPALNSKRAMTPFPQWLRGVLDGGRPLLLSFFMPTPQPVPGRLRLPAESRELIRRGRSELVEGLRITFRRFEAAAWIHDPAGVGAAIARVAGSPPARLPRENTFESKQYGHQLITLTGEDREHIDRLAELDRIVISVAQELGLIGRLEGSIADDLFETTARRLGFQL